MKTRLKLYDMLQYALELESMNSRPMRICIPAIIMMDRISLIMPPCFESTNIVRQYPGTKRRALILILIAIPIIIDDIIRQPFCQEYMLRSAKIIMKQSLN